MAKKECYTHKKFKRSIKLRINMEKVPRFIECNQEAWVERQIDMNTELGKKARNVFAKDFFKMMNNIIFGKTIENVRKHFLRNL